MNVRRRSLLDLCGTLAVIGVLLALLWTVREVERVGRILRRVLVWRPWASAVRAETQRSDLDGVFDLPVRESGDRLADMARRADVEVGTASGALASEVLFEQNVRRG